MISLVEKALRIATKGHEGRSVKKVRFVYCAPCDVCPYAYNMDLLMKWSLLLVHDVLEDTSVSEADFAASWGIE